MTNDKWQMTNQEIDVPGSSSVIGKNEKHGLRLGIRRDPPRAKEPTYYLSFVIFHLSFGRA